MATRHAIPPRDTPGPAGAPLPVCVRLGGQPCLVVGAGPTGLRRAKSLLDAGAQVRLIDPSAQALASAPDACATCARPFDPDDAVGMAIVVAATDDPAVNERIAQAARAAGAWVNRADAPDRSDVTFPATRRQGPITLSLDTAGASAAAAGKLADQALHALDPLWAELLEHALRQRRVIQAELPPGEARRQALSRLADDKALAVLRDQGGEGLATHYDGLVANAAAEAAR
ncbi:MAG: bifunctional precorrin-2 dehydrogenase/sirohydrochlorin ferrochelatase [Planctomycetota bacterium]